MREVLHLRRVVLWLLIGALLAAGSTNVFAHTAQQGAEVPVSGEFVRNGSFSYYGRLTKVPDAWWVDITPFETTKIVLDGDNPVLQMQDDPLVSKYSPIFVWQEIHVPQRTDAATLRFRFRLIRNRGGQARFFVNFETDTGDLLGSYTSPWYTQDTGWTDDTTVLDDAVLQKINAAHEEGKRVRLVIGYYQSQAGAFILQIDDVSLQMSGVYLVPEMGGAIAFIANRNGRATVEWVRPNGTDHTIVWQYPAGSSPKLWDVAWRPDGSEIAFASGHEMGASPFLVDVYAIRPNGTGLRRITNPPSLAALRNSSLPTGTITGRIENRYGLTTAFLIYVQGAKASIAHNPGAYGDTTTFTIPNVVDLGTGQYIVFTWGSGGCAAGVEWELGVPVHVQPGQTVDVGTLTFDGDCKEVEAGNLTWSPNGEEIGFSAVKLGLRARASGEFLGRDLFGTGVGSIGGDLDWSPQTDTILFQGLSSGAFGIYETRVGANTSTLLVSDSQIFGGVTEQEAWLPDGSTFVYSTSTGAIYEYNGNGQDRLLLELNYEIVKGLSVSPDGRYIVFERIMGPLHELWILDRLKPNTLWPLVTGGYATDPDWSRTDPVVSPPPTTESFTTYIPLVSHARR